MNRSITDRAVLNGVTTERTIEVTLTDSLGEGVLGAFLPETEDGVIRVVLPAGPEEARSWVEDREDEHGTFHVFRCTDGARGRQWADPDEAELERLAHDDAAHRTGGDR